MVSRKFIVIIVVVVVVVGAVAVVVAAVVVVHDDGDDDDDDDDNDGGGFSLILVVLTVFFCAMSKMTYCFENSFHIASIFSFGFSWILTKENRSILSTRIKESQKYPFIWKIYSCT